MKWFIIFGTLGFIELLVMTFVVQAVMNWSNKRRLTTGFRPTLMIAAVVAYLYAGYIFFVEGEGSSIAAPNEPFLTTLRTGAPIYLFIMAFLLVLPVIVYATIQSDKLKK